MSMESAWDLVKSKSHPSTEVLSPHVKTPCLLWGGSTSRTGYGRVWFGGRSLIVHRVAVAATGRTIPTGMEVMHVCDVRNCVEPTHLRIGTHAENIADCFLKGRTSRGSHKNVGDNNGMRTTLTMDLAREIKRRLANGEARAALAVEFGVSESHVKNIEYGHRWKAA